MEEIILNEKRYDDYILVVVEVISPLTLISSGLLEVQLAKLLVEMLRKSDLLLEV